MKKNSLDNYLHKSLKDEAKLLFALLDKLANLVKYDQEKNLVIEVSILIKIAKIKFKDK